MLALHKGCSLPTVQGQEPWMEKFVGGHTSILNIWLRFYENERLIPGSIHRKQHRLEAENKWREKSVVYRRRRRSELASLKERPHNLRLEEFTKYEYPYSTQPQTEYLPSIATLRGTKGAQMPMEDNPVKLPPPPAQPHLLRRPCVEPRPEVGQSWHYIQEKGNYLNLKPLVLPGVEAVTLQFYITRFPLILRRLAPGEVPIHVPKDPLARAMSDFHRLSRLLTLQERHKTNLQFLRSLIPIEQDLDFDLPFTTMLLDDCFQPLSWSWYKSTMEELRQRTATPTPSTEAPTDAVMTATGVPENETQNIKARVDS